MTGGLEAEGEGDARLHIAARAAERHRDPHRREPLTVDVLAVSDLEDRNDALFIVYVVDDAIATDSNTMPRPALKFTAIWGVGSSESLNMAPVTLVQSPRRILPIRF